MVMCNTFEAMGHACVHMYSRSEERPVSSLGPIGSMSYIVVYVERDNWLGWVPYIKPFLFVSFGLTPSLLFYIGVQDNTEDQRWYAGTRKL